MSRSNVLKTILDRKLIAIVRRIPPSLMENLMRAFLEGGIHCVEITFDHTGKEGPAETLESIAFVKERLGDKVLLGAGTVLTAQQVQDAVGAGADFILAPNTDPAVIGKARELEAVAIPGAFTPTEIVAAHKAGADIVKLFPATLGGISYIKALMGPLPHIPLAAVGGVDADNAAAFLEAGVSCLGVGSNLSNPQWAEEGRWDLITQAARRCANAVSQAEKR